MIPVAGNAPFCVVADVLNGNELGGGNLERNPGSSVTRAEPRKPHDQAHERREVMAPHSGAGLPGGEAHTGLNPCRRRERAVS